MYQLCLFSTMFIFNSVYLQLCLSSTTFWDDDEWSSMTNVLVWFEITTRQSHPVFRKSTCRVTMMYTSSHTLWAWSLGKLTMVGSRANFGLCRNGINIISHWTWINIFFRKLGTYQQTKMHSTPINQRYTNMLMIASQPSPDSTGPREARRLHPLGGTRTTKTSCGLSEAMILACRVWGPQRCTRGVPLGMRRDAMEATTFLECDDVNSLLLKMAHRHSWFTRIYLLKMLIFQFVFCMSEMW